MENRDEIFVFGSNLAGIHGAGAAFVALKNHGAVMGQGVGLHGSGYALPTKNEQIRTLPLLAVRAYVAKFLEFAEKRRDLTFMVTRVGCGLAGFRDEQIAPMFMNAPKNCEFDLAWEPLLGDKVKYWGTYG